MKMKDENLVAFCGLYCCDCVGYQSEIADLGTEKFKSSRIYTNVAMRNFRKIQSPLNLMFWGQLPIWVTNRKKPKSF